MRDMDPFDNIDLDAEAVWLDGAWYTRDELVAHIRKMVDTGDFKVARPSEALERLDAALRQSSVLSARVPSELASGLAQAARRVGRPVGHLLREAVAYYLAAVAAAARSPSAAGPSVEVDVGDTREKDAEEAFFGKKLGG